MCGICGIFEFNPQKTVKLPALKIMTDSLRHRGPDDEGIYCQGNIGLGNRRLSIIDVEGGHQPIFNEDKNLAIVSNGEIYNFLKLREELTKKGHKFSTKTDTEVILHLYEEEGVNCVKKLDGMFAFAIWDKQRKRLFLARDPLGEKPLHYTLVDGKFIFASEIKGILVHPDFKKEIDRTSLAKYLLYGFIPSPATIFAGIKRLLPGYFMVMEENGKITEKRYWELDYSAKIENLSKAKIKEEIIKLLREAVSKRLISDVPLGVFLSGGVDSSLVVAMMTQLIPSTQIQTFSIGFREKKFDESVYSEMVASHLKVKHHLKIFSQKEILSLTPRIADFLDEPMADPSILPTFLLSSFTNTSVKVVLSGDGGDESFAGYPKYLAHWFLEKTHLPKLPVSILGKFFRGKFGAFLKYSSCPLYLRNQFWISPFSPSQVEELLGEKTDLSDIEHYHSIFNGQDYLDESFFLDQKLTLPDLYLVKTDRASMAASLEVRSPFLDKKLVEFCAKIPSRLKLEGFKTKSLLKEIALEFLPKEVVSRRKMGFGIPLSEWTGSKLRPLISENLNFGEIKNEGIFNPQVVERIIRKGTPSQVWTLLVFHLWKKKWLKN